MMEQAKNEQSEASNGSRAPEWHNVRLRAEEFAYLERAAKQANLSVAANLQRMIRRDRSVGAVHTLIENLAEQIRVLEQFTQKSASDITSRLRRIETDRSVKANRERQASVTPEGIPFEVYDRFQLTLALVHLRDLVDHWVPELGATAEERADAAMDRLYGVGASDAASGQSEDPTAGEGADAGKH